MADETIKQGGYVYFMTNPAIPGHVKIGSTRLTPDERARQLSSGTAVARPFKVIAFQWFEGQMLLHAERELHAKYRQYRVPHREFFELDLTVEQARGALLEVHTLLTIGKPIDKELQLAPSVPSNVKSAPREETNASVLGLAYWTEFNKMRDEQKLPPRFENAGPRPRFFHRYFLVNPSQKTGHRNIHYEGRIRINPPQVSMRLIFKTADDIKKMFDLIAQDRREIDQEMDFRLAWSREQGAKEAHIAAVRDDMDPREAAKWEQQHQWLSYVVSAFEKVIRPRVEELPPPAQRTVAVAPEATISADAFFH
jgi:hypothetical protein